MSRITAAIIISAASLLSGCGSRPVAADAILRAENAIYNGNMSTAQECADSLLAFNNENPETLTPSELCRLALIYKKLADNSLTYEDINTTNALKLYKKAFATNADSVIIYRRSLTLDDAAAFEVLSSLHAMADSPVDLEAEEPLDSMGLGDDIYPESATSH